VSLSPELTEEVLYEYKRLRSPFKVAKALGLDPHRVWLVIEENSDRLSPHTEKYGGEGRPELRDHLVARRRAGEREWDNTDPAIAGARAAYEAGTVEMCTGRDGNWLLLYAIPRRRPDPRPDYFLPEW
jgi:hypothetical protein